MDAVFPLETSQDVTAALEKGQVVVRAKGGFVLEPEEERLLDPALLGGAKNISLSPRGALKHSAASGEIRDRLESMMGRYADFASTLMGHIAPSYRSQIIRGRTSFRPAEIEGRKSSPLKDDSRLHIDAFPTTPMQGRRILRVFCNVNPAAPRVWQVGEDFETMARRFLPEITPKSAMLRGAMARLGLTKGYRTLYDEWMLGLHDAAKRDLAYQRNCNKQRLEFPPGTVWLCFTDQVMHAALKGQHALEQTFYLPPSAMLDSAASPLAVLERLTGKDII